MRYKLTDIITFLFTPIGRMQLLESLYQFFWVFLAPLSKFYRGIFLRNVCVVAVVGSVGKTTTSHLLSAVFKKKFYRNSYRNSFSFIASKLLRTKPGDKTVVVEVGVDRPGQMEKYAKIIQPNITVVTTIGSDHNNALKNLNVTRHEKSYMIQCLTALHSAVLNGDDPNVIWMKTQTQAQIVTYGLKKTNDIYASDIRLQWPKGMQFVVHFEGQERVIQTKLLGRHMIYSLLAAIAVGRIKGISISEIISKLSQVSPISGRMQLIKLSNYAYILRDDFKASLETLYAAFKTLSQVPANRKIVVLGNISHTPGSKGPILRDIGQQLALIATKVIMIGQDYKIYAAGFRRAGGEPQAIIKSQRSVVSVIKLLKDDLGPHDIVLIKGRITQRLERIAFGLMGKKVACNIEKCTMSPVRCEYCPMLERGW